MAVFIVCAVAFKAAIEFIFQSKATKSENPPTTHNGNEKL